MVLYKYLNSINEGSSIDFKQSWCERTLYKENEKERGPYSKYLVKMKAIVSECASGNSIIAAIGLWIHVFSASGEQYNLWTCFAVQVSL